MEEKRRMRNRKLDKKLGKSFFFPFFKKIKKATYYYLFCRWHFVVKKKGNERCGGGISEISQPKLNYRKTIYLWGKKC